MIKLKDSEIKQILPEYLSEKSEVKALSFAISRAVWKLIEYCRNIGVYSAIDQMPDDILDLLAVELNTQYYDTSLDIEAKRKLIKGTLVWYERAGTPAAVEELVAAVFGEGQVKEWFEYGGDPYYFKIEADVPLTPEAFEQLKQMIIRVKNTRSHIDSINVTRRIDQTLYTGVAGRSHMRNVITDSRANTDIHNAPAYTGTTFRHWIFNKITQ